MLSIIPETVRPEDRFDYWCEVADHELAPMRYDRVGERPPLGDIGVQMMGELPLIAITVAGTHVTRTRSEIARTKDRLYALCLQLDGSSHVTRRGEDIPIRRGEVFILDSVHEFELDLEGLCRQLIVKMPAHWIEARVARPDQLIGTVLQDHPLSRLLARYLADGLEMADAVTPATAEMFAEHTIDLVTQAIAEIQSGGAPPPPDAWHAAMFLRACRMIAREFGDPDLRPLRIARALHISTRTLDRIFAEQGESVMQRIFEERVGRTATLLASPAAAHRSITEIAFACGFHDSAHFTRTFAARMGMTPSRWRKERSP
jgi:AraC-like DNA-binding protein